MTISQQIAAVPTADDDAPTFDQGETADNPKPAPRASMISETEAATKAPAITAPQDTPDEFWSLLDPVAPSKCTLVSIFKIPPSLENSRRFSWIR
jgi:hypothetical protein